MIVSDTSIIAYLLIEGGKTEICRSVFEKDPEWCAPFLWRSEFRNVLATHMRHAGMSPDGAMARMTQAEAILHEREHSVSSDLVIELCSTQGVSAYDAEFVCLADQLKLNLVTTDKALLGKFPDIAFTPEGFTSK